MQEEADLSVLGPNVERLWTYGGVLTKCHNISCMTWNKKNQDILAVGYGEYGFTNQKSGELRQESRLVTEVCFVVFKY